jgi:hypothetical protein
MQQVENEFGKINNRRIATLFNPYIFTNFIAAQANRLEIKILQINANTHFQQHQFISCRQVMSTEVSKSLRSNLHWTTYCTTNKKFPSI